MCSTLLFSGVISNAPKVPLNCVERLTYLQGYVPESKVGFSELNTTLSLWEELGRGAFMTIFFFPTQQMASLGVMHLLLVVIMSTVPQSFLKTSKCLLYTKVPRLSQTISIYLSVYIYGHHKFFRFILFKCLSESLLLHYDEVIWSSMNYFIPWVLLKTLRIFRAPSVVALFIHSMVGAACCCQDTFMTAEWKNCRGYAWKSVLHTTINWEPSGASTDAWIWLVLWLPKCCNPI